MWRRRLGGIGRWGMLALTLAVMVAWPMSRRWTVSLELPGEREISVRSSSLWLITYTPAWLPDQAIPPGLHVHDNRTEGGPVMQMRLVMVSNRYADIVRVPLWSMVLVLGAGTATAWRKQLRAIVKRDRPKDRRKRGACLACGYDRAGLPAAAACPECGAGPAGSARGLGIGRVGGGVGESGAMWRRLRVVSRWVIAPLTAALLIAWPLTRLWVLGLTLPGKGDIRLCAGTVQFGVYAQPLWWPRKSLPLGLYFYVNDIARQVGLQWRFAYYKAGATRMVTVPLWSIVLVLGAGTALAWRKHVPAVTRRGRAEARRKRGGCAQCGYDRSGLGAGVVCPECGAVPAG